jgi:uncharacterized protein (DUF3084 family)
MTAISRRSLVASLRRARRDRDDARTLAIAYKRELEQALQSHRDLAADFEEVRKGLTELRALSHRYRMIDAAVRAGYDPMESSLQ